MKKMKKPLLIFQVDAFTDQPFRGNPAGVCLLDEEMPDEWMQNVASEMNLSETAFIIKGINDYHVRFFTPESEIPLCGHATLSSAHILYETGISSIKTKIKFISRAGELITRSSEGWIIMDFPSYSLEKTVDKDDFVNKTGMKPSELFRTSHGWTFALFENEAEIRNLKPDFRLLKNSPYGELIVTSLSGDPVYDFCVRCFVPALGIDEDPVTGSAHCALVPFWASRLGKNSLISHQVSKREGILKVKNKSGKVEIAGQAKTIIRGELFI